MKNVIVIAVTIFSLKASFLLFFLWLLSPSILTTFLLMSTFLPHLISYFVLNKKISMAWYLICPLITFTLFHLNDASVYYSNYSFCEGRMNSPFCNSSGCRDPLKYNFKDSISNECIERDFKKPDKFSYFIFSLFENPSVKGQDSNNNGVRESVEAYISTLNIRSNVILNNVYEQAALLQKILVSDNKEDINKSFDRLYKLRVCSKVFDLDSIQYLDEETLNTKKRRLKFYNNLRLLNHFDYPAISKSFFENFKSCELSKKSGQEILRPYIKSWQFNKLTQQEQLEFLKYMELDEKL